MKTNFVVRFLLLALVFAAEAPAEQFLCITKVATIIGVSPEGQKMTGDVYEDTGTKYIFSNNSGAWKAKQMDEDYWAFNRCSATGHICEGRPLELGLSALWAGPRIVRSLNGNFYVNETREGKEGQFIATHAGTCSEF